MIAPVDDPIAWLFEVTDGLPPRPGESPDWSPRLSTCPGGWRGCRHYRGWHVFARRADDPEDAEHYATRLDRDAAVSGQGAVGVGLDLRLLEHRGPTLAEVVRLVEAAERRGRP